MSDKLGEWSPELTFVKNMPPEEVALELKNLRDEIKIYKGAQKNLLEQISKHQKQVTDAYELLSAAEKLFNDEHNAVLDLSDRLEKAQEENKNIESWFRGVGKENTRITDRVKDAIKILEKSLEVHLFDEAR
jgi:chromosome segregation ATPase